MKFLLLNGTLKVDSELSNTFTLCQMVKAGFEALGHECEMVTLSEMEYKRSTDDVQDDLQPIIQKMFSVDGLIFATPIWWGGHSSYIQTIIERMDFIETFGYEKDYKPFYGKVFGTVVSGGGDGFQHIHGTNYNFATMLGFTVPPQCNIESATQGRDKILKDDETIGMVKTFVANMSAWAKALKDGEVHKFARHTTKGTLKESINERKRIPRKKGQKRKSKKHSDLYTDEDPKGTIHGLGFKDEAAARSSVTKIRKSGRSHAHKIQAAVAMEQRAKAAGKAGPAAIYRRFINSMKKKTKAKKKK